MTSVAEYHKSEGQIGILVNNPNTLLVSDDLEDLSCGTNSTIPLIPRVVQDYSDTYRHASIVQLPKLVMDLCFTYREVQVMNLFLRSICIGKYLLHQDGKKSLAEEFNIFRNQDDIILALDGEDLSGVCVKELLQQMLCKEVGSTATLTILDRERFNSGMYRTVWIGQFRHV